MKNLSHVSTWTCVIAGLMALSFWPSCVSAGELQNLLDKSQAFAALPRVTHTPVFRLEPFEPAQHRKEAQGKAVVVHLRRQRADRVDHDLAESCRVVPVLP